MRRARSLSARRSTDASTMVAASLFLLALTASGPDVRALSFEAYPSLVPEPKSLAPANLTSNPRAHDYRTVIRRSDAQPVNFAGHLTVTRIGCGTSCAFLVLVDRRDGHVHFFPDGVLSWAGDFGDDYGFTFRRESRLLRACGQLNEAGPSKCWYYEWARGGPKLVAERPWKRRRTSR